MILHIKNMVCPRCIMAVESILHKLAVPFSEVKMGEASIDGEIHEDVLPQLESELRIIGFEVVTDPKTQLLEQVRLLIREYVEDESESKVNLSVMLSATLDYDYTYLSNLFSAETGSTIEKYYITRRIEKAKELLRHGNASVSDIAGRLGYSSGAYLSSQFKKHTGVTPGQYKSSLGLAANL